MFGIAIAGFGWWGQHMARRLESHANYAVLGVVEPDIAKRADIAAAGLEWFSSLDTALMREDVDAVILTTPNTLHEEQVIRCARAGKHVFCEKPLGLTAASARRSVTACKEASVQLGIGHERRFESAMLALKHAIDHVDLGTIMHAEAAFSHDKLIHVPRGRLANYGIDIARSWHDRDGYSSDRSLDLVLRARRDRASHDQRPLARLGDR